MAIEYSLVLLSNNQEADKKTIELHGDDDHEAVMAMLRHLYGSSYKEQETWVLDHDRANAHLSVFMLGDKYDIKSLRDQAAECFNDVLEEDKRADCLYDETVDAIQKLLGPNAPQLADQTLVQSATNFVLENLFLFFLDEHFRKLLAEGVMFKKELALEFLTDLSGNI